MASRDPSGIGAFPLIRHVSVPVTRLLLATPLAPNHVTALSLAFGFAAAVEFAEGGWLSGVIGSALFFVSYILDNSDGEIARRKNQSSEFGRRFDTFVNWSVHTAFFLGLGYGTTARTDETFWLWLGLAAAAGGTINYGIGLVRDRLAPVAAAPAAPVAAGPGRPTHATDWILFAFRELARADFCFLVLAFALLDASWVLLVAGAVGAHVYWLVSVVRGARDDHV